MKATVLLFLLLISLGAGSAASADCRVPRSGWALKPVKHGEIGELYWATHNYSERWITLKPLTLRPKDQSVPVPEIVLIFSVCFPGKNLETPLPTVQIRAQINRNFIPAFVPGPTLELAVDNGPFSELTKRFPDWTAVPDGCAPADPCAHEAVIVEVPVSMLKEMGAGTIVRGSVSGTPFELGQTQLEQLERFVKRIGH